MKTIPFLQFGRELFPSHTLLALSGPGTKKVKMKDTLSDSTGTGHPRGNVRCRFIVHSEREWWLEKLTERSKFVGCTVLG